MLEKAAVFPAHERMQLGRVQICECSVASIACKPKELQPRKEPTGLSRQLSRPSKGLSP